MMLPICANPTAFKQLSAIATNMESPDALLIAAVAISRHKLPMVKIDAIDKTIQHHVNKIRSKIKGRQPQALLANLHKYLFDDLGFIGNSIDYEAANNNYLPIVLDTKTGLPTILCLIYKLIANRLGLKVHGIGLPSHFIVGVESGSIMLIDPFNGGRLISQDEANEIAHARFGQEFEWSDDMLEPISNLHWITRIMQNLLHTFGIAGQYEDVAAMIEFEIVLWPECIHLQRDLALVLARIGLSGPATAWLASYLQAEPNDPQKDDLEQLLSALRE